MFYWSRPDVPFDQGMPPWVGPLNLPIWPSSWSPPSCVRSVNPPPFQCSKTTNNSSLRDYDFFFIPKVTESAKSNFALDLTAFMPAAMGRWGTKGLHLVPLPFQSPPFFIPRVLAGPSQCKAVRSPQRIWPHVDRIRIIHQLTIY